jgi:hypothetical protein
MKKILRPVDHRADIVPEAGGIPKPLAGSWAGFREKGSFSLF